MWLYFAKIANIPNFTSITTKKDYIENKKLLDRVNANFFNIKQYITLNLSYGENHSDCLLMLENMTKANNNFISLSVAEMNLSVEDIDKYINKYIKYSEPFYHDINLIILEHV